MEQLAEMTEDFHCFFAGLFEKIVTIFTRYGGSYIMSGFGRIIKMFGIVCALMMACSSLAIAQLPIISTWHIPFYLEDKNNGPFIEMIKEIEKRTNHKFEIQILPVKRSIQYFKKGKTSILFPAMQPNLPDGLEVIRSVPFMKKAIYAFVRKENPIPLKFDDLIGKNIGLVRGYSYPNEVTGNDRIEVQYATDATQSMKKLEVGWADIVLDDINVGKEAIAKTGVKNIIFDETMPFAFVDVFFAFQASPEGELLSREFSNALMQIKLEGKMQKFISRPVK